MANWGFTKFQLSEAFAFHKVQINKYYLDENEKRPEFTVAMYHNCLNLVSFFAVLIQIR